MKASLFSFKKPFGSISKVAKTIFASLLVLTFMIPSITVVSETIPFDQPSIGVKTKSVLTVDGYQFKDSNGNGTLDPYEDWRLSPQERAADLVSKMTLAEKSGQMVIHSKSTSNSGTIAITANDRRDIVDNHLRHFVERNNPTPSRLATYHNLVQELAEGTRLGIPALFASNPRNENSSALEFGFQEASGVFATFPGTLGIAAAAKGDVKLDPTDYSVIDDFAEIARQEWNATGISKGYMYMADLSADPRWARNYGTFGEDPEFISDVMSHLIKGFQNGDTLSPGGVAQTTKHFPGGGAPLNGMDPHNVMGKYSIYRTPGSLEKYHVPPFKAAIDAGSASIMPYYSQPHPDSAPQTVGGVALDLQKEPYGNAFNTAVVGTLLRDILGFKGYVNSDSNILTNMWWGFENATPAVTTNDPRLIIQAVNAGTDMFSNYQDSVTFSNTPTHVVIQNAVNNGEITQKRVDDAATSILIELFQLGYFENPYRDPAEADAVVGTESHWDTAYEVHQKSVVLLKNNENVLPLTADKVNGKKVYVEAFANNATNTTRNTTAVRNAAEGAFGAGVTFTTDYTEADYALLFLFPASTSSTSGNVTSWPAVTFCDNKAIPRIDGAGTQNQTTLLGVAKLKMIYDNLNARGAKVITNMDLKTEFVVDNAEIYSHALLAGFSTFAEATLDVITGVYSPTGVLPFTLPSCEEVLAIGDDWVCASPNDVPGYDKDQYIAKSLLDEIPGNSYTYRDTVGNFYGVDFGLGYPKQVELGVKSKGIIESGGYQFKDSNGNGALDKYEDWRLPSETRAKALVEIMTLQEKAGQMVINTKSSTANPPSSDTQINNHMRHFIERANLQPSVMATYWNRINELAEASRLGIPAIAASNPRNENSASGYGLQEASGTFAMFPGTLGLAAAAKGDIAAGGDASLISEHARIARSEWNAVGIRKAYAYMADVTTDPRWTRTNGTFGEDPTFVADAIYRNVSGFQGDSLTSTSIAMTTKHFPGGGARENGFDPHVAAGKWNIYATPGSLEKYHLPPFQAAVDAGTSAIMPYYSSPNAGKSSEQTVGGNDIPLKQEGFAFNSVFLGDLLRGQMGFKGYINSDTGILGSTGFGDITETLAQNSPARAAWAINNGTDIISGTSDPTLISRAYDQGLLSMERIDEAVIRLLTELFDLGLFENPYRDPGVADEVVANPENWDKAYEAHQKSVVLLKNTNSVLPLTDSKLAGKKVYIEVFANTATAGTTQTTAMRTAILADDPLIVMTDDYTEADYAILFARPAGASNNQTSSYFNLELCDSMTVPRIAGGTETQTWLAGANKLQTIYQDLNSRGAKVITNVNCEFAWILGGAERYADALLVGFNTLPSATLDVIRGRYNPTGKLPLTMPANGAVIAVDANAVCVSPNDVPGYDKDKYISASVLAQTPGNSYAYYDSDGNYYSLDFGLSYKGGEVIETPGIEISISKGTVTAKAVVDNISLAGTESALIIALYDTDNKLISFKQGAAVNVDASGKLSVSASVRATGNQDVAVIKAFLWNNKTKLPLLPSAEKDYV